jgi:ribosome biogenesis GTPase A
VHRRYVKVAEQEGRNIGEIATSYLYLAQYELDLLHRDANNYQDEDEDEDEMSEEKKKPLGCGRTTEGEASGEPDIESAITWLIKVIESGAPEREMAEEDLRYVRRKQGRRRVTFSPEV